MGRLNTHSQLTADETSLRPSLTSCQKDRLGLDYTALCYMADLYQYDRTI